MTFHMEKQFLKLTAEISILSISSKESYHITVAVKCAGNGTLMMLICFSTGIVLEAKGIKEHHWKPFIKQLFEKKV